MLVFDAESHSAALVCSHLTLTASVCGSAGAWHPCLGAPGCFLCSRVNSLERQNSDPFASRAVLNCRVSVEHSTGQHYKSSSPETPRAGSQRLARKQTVNAPLRAPTPPQVYSPQPCSWPNSLARLFAQQHALIARHLYLPQSVAHYPHAPARFPCTLFPSGTFPKHLSGTTGLRCCYLLEHPNNPPCLTNGARAHNTSFHQAATTASAAMS